MSVHPGRGIWNQSFSSSLNWRSQEDRNVIQNFQLLLLHMNQELHSSVQGITFVCVLDHYQHLSNTSLCGHWCVRIRDFLMPEQRQHCDVVCNNLRQQDQDDLKIHI